MDIKMKQIIKFNDGVREKIEDKLKEMYQSDKIKAFYVGVTELCDKDMTYMDGVYVIGDQYNRKFLIYGDHGVGSLTSDKAVLDNFLERQFNQNISLVLKGEPVDNVMKTWVCHWTEPMMVMEVLIYE